VQRCYPGVVSAVDQKEAFEAGENAVKFALTGDTDGSVAFRRAKGSGYGIEYFRTPLSTVAKDTSHLPDSFINKAGNNITQAFVNYALPLVGKLAPVAHLSKIKVRKKR